jgi:DNA polymerase beta
LEDDSEDKKAEAMALFTRVSGVGPIAARKFVDGTPFHFPGLITEGLLTLDDLRKKFELTPHQSIGLKYFEELEKKIPREEMDIWKVLSLFGTFSDEQTTIQTAAETVDVDFQCTFVGQ